MQIIANSADELFDNIVTILPKYARTDLNISHEIINANLILSDPTRNTMCNCKRKMPMRYAIGELLWYNSRNNTCKAIEPYSKFWNNIADDGEHVNSNYGWCIHDKFDFDQWQYVKCLFRQNPETRQAIIHIKEPRNTILNPTKDLNCTLSLQFLLRDNKLDLITTMRSNDLWLGLPYDLFNFTCMQIQMAMELNVKIGTYYHNAGSLHLYRRDLEKLEDLR